MRTTYSTSWVEVKHVFCVLFIFLFTLVGQGQHHIDKGRKAEIHFQNKIDIQTTIDQIFSKIIVNSKEKEKLQHHYEHQLTKLKGKLIVKTIRDSKDVDEQTIQKLIHEFIQITIKDFNKYGMVVLDETALAIKKGKVFKGPFNLPPPLETPGPNEPCNNLDFETGDLTGWEGSKGEVKSQAVGAQAYSYINQVAGLDPVHHTIVGAGNDPQLSVTPPLEMVNPDGGANSVRLGDLQAGYGAAEIKQTFQVGTGNSSFSYSYAVVLQDPSGHTVDEKPYFTIRMLDQNGDEIDCATYNVIAGSGISGFEEDSANGFVAHRFKRWSTVFIPLGGFVGQNVTIIFRTGDCAQGGHYGYAYIDASCKELDLQVKRVNNDCNNPNAILTAPNGGASYLWSTGATTQSITALATGTYTVTITSPAGPSCKSTLTYTFESNPKPPIASFKATEACNGDVVSFTDESISNTSKAINKWEWEFDPPDGSVQQNPDYTFTTGGTHNVKLTVTNSQGCIDDTIIPITIFYSVEANPVIEYSCTDLAKVTIKLVSSVGTSTVNYNIDGGPFQSDSVFTNLQDGPHTFSWNVDGKCPKDTTITISNWERTQITVEPVTGKYCEGDKVDLTSKDPNCANMEWYADFTTTTALGGGCDYSFTMGSSDKCIFYEPTVLSSAQTVGASQLQGWGESATGTFEAISALTIDGFSINGKDYWNGCAPTTVTFSVKQGSTVIAGPVTQTIQCDRTVPNVITGLNFKVPPGTGYSLVIDGNGTGGVQTMGTIVNDPTLINISASGPFYNWQVFKAPICPIRDSICVVNDCPCPDTSLTFPPDICKNSNFNLNDLLTATTSPGKWSIVSTPNGGTAATITKDSLFNDSKDGQSGTYVVQYTLDGGPYPGCADSNVRSITIVNLDTSNITKNQGPYCIDGGKQIIKLESNSTLGGTWTSKTANSIVANTGEFDPKTAGLGKHWIYYTTPGTMCPAMDSIEVEVTNSFVALILTPDTSVCAGSNSFTLRLDTQSSQNGTWSGTGVSGNNFNPTSSGIGAFKIKYKVGANNPACSDSDSITITVVAPDTASITPNQGPFCIADGKVIIQTESNNTAGGVWSNAKNAINTSTGEFDPAVSDTGKHWIFYNTPNGNLCPAIDSIEIEIKPALTATILNNDTSVCFQSSSFDIRLSSNSNTEGSWTGSGLTGTSFNPSNVQPGTYTIVYKVDGFNNSCSDSDSVKITVNNPDTANITPNQGPFCTADGKFTLKSESNQTAGGIWSTVSGAINSTTGEFDPATSGNGKFWVYYNTPTSGACPDVDSIEIEITPDFTALIATPDTSICFESDAFDVRLLSNSTKNGMWSGTGLTGTSFDPSSVQPGIYSIKYAVYGLTKNCSDSDSINITVVAPDTAIITSNQGPYCRLGGNDTLSLETTTTPGGSWSSTTATISSTFGVLDPKKSGAGKHWVFYTTPGNLCPVIDSIEIEVIQEKEATILTSDTTICANSSSFPIIISTSSAQDGVWSGTGIVGGTFSPQNTGEGQFSIHYHVVGISAACSDSDSVVVTVLPNMNATINVPNKTVFCVGDSSLNLSNLDSNINGVWTSLPIGNISNSGSFTPAITNVGKTIIAYTIQGMCGDTDTIHLNVKNYIDPTITPIVPLCEILDDVSLSAVNVGSWTINGTPNNGTFSPQTLGPGTYEVVNTINNLCPSQDTIIIEVKPNPQPILSADTLEGCFPLEVNFTDNTDSNALTTQWEITEGSTSLLKTNQLDSLKHVFNEVGCYNVSLTSTYEYGCKNTASYDYQICTYPHPKADFNFLHEPINIEDPKVYMVNQSKNGTQYTWDFGRGEILINSNEEPIVEYITDEQDTVSITLVVSNGWCLDSIQKSIIIWDVYSLFVANAFTPNDDGLNDMFFPLGKNHVYENYQFLIYNRWGENIWSTNTPYLGWDGTDMSTGQKVQVDTYVWKIISKDQYKNETKQHVGIVSVIK